MKQTHNYLDFVPKIKPDVRYEITTDSSVTLFIENRGIMNRLTQKFLHKPRITQVHLDAIGNFIWPLMDGNHTVFDIATQVHNHFGPDAEPLYERLVRYMEMLVQYEFVEM